MKYEEKKQLKLKGIRDIFDMGKKDFYLLMAKFFFKLTKILRHRFKEYYKCQLVKEICISSEHSKTSHQNKQKHLKVTREKKFTSPFKEQLMTDDCLFSRNGRSHVVTGCCI